MTDFGKYLRFATIAMFVITGVIGAFFYFGGEVPNQVHDTPVYTNSMIVWAYILLAIAAGSAVLFAISVFFTNFKEAKKGLFALIGLAVILLVSYALSDNTPFDLPGYTGGDNTPATLSYAGTVLITTYILGIGAIVSIFATEIISKKR